MLSWTRNLSSTCFVILGVSVTLSPQGQPWIYVESLCSWLLFHQQDNTWFWSAISMSLDMSPGATAILLFGRNMVWLASRIISCPWYVILYRPSLSTLPRTCMVLLLKEIFENLFRSKWHWQLNRLWQWILLGSTTCPCPYPLSIWQPNLLKLHLSRRCWDYKWYNQF